MAQVRSKLAAGRSWRQKLEATHPGHGKTAPMPAKWAARYGKGRMLIPKPLDIDAILRGVRKGSLITHSQIRERLARAAGVAATCPLTTGIFLRIVAEASEEDRRDGRTRVTPFWRAIRDDGKLNDKYPGGVQLQARRLREEGFTVQAGKSGSVLRVVDHEAFLVDGR